MTRNGIEYDLKKSPYTIYNSRTGIKFYFSSLKYLEKFMLACSEEVQIMNYSFKKKYLISFRSDYLALINLYRKIEKRGFLIEIKEKYYNNPPMMKVVMDDGY